MVRFHSDSIDIMDFAPRGGSQANQLNHWHESDPWVTGTGFEASYMSEDPMWDIKMVLSGISIAAVLTVRTLLHYSSTLNIGSVLFTLMFTSTQHGPPPYILYTENNETFTLK